MNFGKRTSSAEAERSVRRALDRGLVFFDAANRYCDGESERINRTAKEWLRLVVYRDPKKLARISEMV